MPEKKSISLNRGREESLGNDDVLASKQCRTPAFQFPIFFQNFPGSRNMTLVTTSPSLGASNSTDFLSQPFPE